MDGWTADDERYFGHCLKVKYSHGGPRAVTFSTVTATVILRNVIPVVRVKLIYVESSQ